MSRSLLSRPGGIAAGEHTVPGDKSVSHRALVLASVAEGETVIGNFLDGSDCRATANALRALGADIAAGENEVRVAGGGRFVSPSEMLDLGNSGTGLRLLAGLLAGRAVNATLGGDASLCSRPMRRIADPLNAMGASIETTAEGTAPLRVRGRQVLRGIEYRLPVASAQVKSAILLAGLAATGTVTVHEPAITRDHTERLLGAFGATVSRMEGTICLEPGARLVSPGRVDVPGDLSSAAFLFAAAAATSGASVTVRGLGVNPTRAGFLDLLARMGARISLDAPRDYSGEPVADVTVRGAGLRGIDVDGHEVALSIDEIPLLIAMAAVADGETVVRGAGELRFKESDRLAAMADGLGALGIRHTLLADGIRVFGGQPQGGTIDSRGDHRVAMSFAILGQHATNRVEIRDTGLIDTSFPGFAAAMQRAGLDITENKP